MGTGHSSAAGDGEALRADSSALDHLFSVTYEELRRLAASVRRGDPSATLSPTALVNEAWLKLAGSPRLADTSPLHFKRIAARAMRQVLIEAARRRHADKRGGGRGRRHLRRVTRGRGRHRRPARPRRRARGAGPAQPAAGGAGREPVLRRARRGGDRRAARRVRGDGAARLARREGLARPRAARHALDSGGRIDAARWERVQQLFHDAAERPAAERRAFLEYGVRRRPGTHSPRCSACSRPTPTDTSCSTGTSPTWRARCSTAACRRRCATMRFGPYRITARARRRRHGRRLPRRARRPRQRRRHQDPARRLALARAARALRRRAAHARPAQPPLHRAAVRRRLAPRRHAVVRHGVRRGRPLTDYCRSHGSSHRGAARALPRGVRGGAARPRARRHPPRPQALEHPGDGRRHGEAARLRHRQASRAPRRHRSTRPAPGSGS